VILGLVAEPPDSDDVLRALRLGWALAEVRGRLRVPNWGAAPKRQPPKSLPLADERSWSEQTIETEKIADRLAGELNVESSENPKKQSALEMYSEKLRAAPADELGRAWANVSEFLWTWDAEIQDTLATRSFAVASGYQLGRGLSEVYWALDTKITDPNNMCSARFLLGPGRLRAFERLLPRLSAYFTSTTLAVVQASLTAWGQVANDGLFEAKPVEVRDALHEQLRVWHDLLLVGQAPEARVRSEDLVSRARRIRPVLRAFVPEALLGLASLTLAVLAALLFAIGTWNHAIAPVLSVFSVFGVTSVGALAKAKNSANSLFVQLRVVLDIDLVKEAVTLPPAQFYLDSEPKRLGRATARERALEELRDPKRDPTNGNRDVSAQRETLS